jgi:RHS repeat-associated protein
MHRLLSVTYTNSYTDSKHFVYDSATVNGINLSNVKGRLAEAYTCGSSGCSTKKTDIGFTYTARGEMESSWESTPNSGGYLNLCVAYWPNGMLKSLNCLAQLPYIVYGSTNGSNSSGLDGEGRVTYVWAQSGHIPVTSVTYTATSSSTSFIGGLTNVTYGSGDSDTFTYDPNTGRMTSFTGTAGSGSQKGTLSWNEIGSLARLTITDTINSSNAQTCNFSYDDLARVALNDCGSTWHQTFSFDPFGNISKTATAGTSFLPTYSQSTNQITALPGCSPTYDSNGNMTNDCAHTYATDTEGHTITIDSTSITYDALGRAVEWNVGSGYRQVVYDPFNRKIALMSGVSTLIKSFFPLPGGGEMVDTPGVLPAYYRHSDLLGSSRLATTQSGTVYFDTAYAAYGENYVGSGTADLDFTGQNQDTASGLYDFLYRKYSPVQGRWISPDPAGLSAVDITNPQSWNRYAYVTNNPLSLTDPSGLCARDGPCRHTPTPPNVVNDEFDLLYLAFAEAILPATEVGAIIDYGDLGGLVDGYLPSDASYPSYTQGAVVYPNTGLFALIGTQFTTMQDVYVRELTTPPSLPTIGAYHAPLPTISGPPQPTKPGVIECVTNPGDALESMSPNSNEPDSDPDFPSQIYADRNSRQQLNPEGDSLAAGIALIFNYVAEAGGCLIGR